MLTNILLDVLQWTEVYTLLFIKFRYKCSCSGEKFRTKNFSEEVANNNSSDLHHLVCVIPITILLSHERVCQEYFDVKALTRCYLLKIVIYRGYGY